MAHKLLKVRSRGPDKEMEMISHKNESNNVYPIYLRRTFKKRDEFYPVIIVSKDVLLRISPAGHMVNCILVLDS